MKVLTIGRSQENDVVIDDSKVSRHHLQIIKDEYGNFHLSDFGSLNGTYVNGVKIQGEVSLSSNDIVKIGNTVLPWKAYFINRGPGPESPLPRERHGFITFWFILSIICSLISMVFIIWQYSQVKSAVTQYRGMEDDLMDSLASLSTINLVLGILGIIIGIGCIILLFNWKKIGFYIAVASGLVLGGINVYVIQKISDISAQNATASIIIMLISLVVAPLILYAIFQLRKHGVKFWDNLE
jgi:hypothetical protein